MSMNRPICAVLFALAVTLLAQAAWAQRVGVGGGAGYKRLITELDAAFTAKSGVAVEETFGHMGHVTAQVKQGGHIDIVFGDLDFLKNVPGFEAERYIEAGRGRLVAAWPKGVSLASPKDLAKPEFDRIALPDTKNAIYGKAGMEFLTRSGLLEAVKPRLVEVSTVPQVTAYLVAGEVKAGFVNLTDAVGAKDKIGGWIEIDQSLYSPIKIVAAVIPGASNRPEVARYLEFLSSDQAKAILEKHGL